MGIVRKKYLSKKQNGGSKIVGSTPKVNGGIGATGRVLYKAGIKAKNFGVEAGKAVGAVVVAPLAIASAGVGVAAGIVKSIPSGLKAVGKTAFRAPMLAYRSYNALNSKQKLREKLGVDHPASEIALKKFAARKTEINKDYENKLKQIKTGSLSGRTWYGTKTNLGKEVEKQSNEVETKRKRLEYNKNRQTERLLSELKQFHRKKSLGGVSEYKTSWGLLGRRSKKGETTDYTELKKSVTPTGKANEDFTQTLTQAQKNLANSYEKGKKRAQAKVEEFKKKDVNYKALATNVVTKKGALNTKTDDYETAKKKYQQAQTDLLKLELTDKNYFKTKIDLDMKKILLDRERTDYKSAYETHINAEKKLQKATPRDIDNYESAYYKKTQKAKNLKSNISQYWKTAKQNIANTARTFTAFNTAIYGEKKPTTPVTPNPNDPNAQSQYSLRQRMNIQPFGIKPISSTLDKTEKIYSILYDNNKNKPKLNIGQLDNQITDIKAKLKTESNIEDKNKLQIQLQTLLSDRLTRENLLKRAKLTIIDSTDENFKTKNLEQLQTLNKYSKLITRMNDPIANKTYIAEELSENIKSLVSQADYASGNDKLKILKELQIFKNLYKYYKGKSIEEQINLELAPPQPIP